MDWILWIIIVVGNIKRHFPLETFRTEAECNTMLLSVKADMDKQYPGDNTELYCEVDESSVDLSRHL